MKYLALSAINAVGQLYDTKEEAERAARGMDYFLDSMTGYSTAFNTEPLNNGNVEEIERESVSAKEYLENIIELEKAEEAFEKEVEELRKKRLGKYYTLTHAYINLNTPYGYNDLIRIVTKRKSGRKRTLEGRVCGVLITDDGNIRPSIRGEEYPEDEQILSIEVLERYDFLNQKQRVICQNCKYYNSVNYNFGSCALHKIEVNRYKENQECYINDPNKK